MPEDEPNFPGAMGRAMKRIAAAAFAVVALAGPAAAVQDDLVTIKKTPDVAKGVAAFPRLAGGDAITQKINNALAKGDLRVRKAAKDCATEGKGRADWSRGVEVSMRGPRFVSYVANDSYFCGGAYPDVSTVALVYDLATGIPVDWTKLLPATLAVTPATTTGGDGTVVGTVADAKLTELYVKAVKADGVDEQCDDVLKQTDLHFIVWPDVKAEGLMLQQMDLPHVVAACGPAATIPMAALRELGVDAGLLDAIEAGHRAGK